MSQGTGTPTRSVVFVVLVGGVTTVAVSLVIGQQSWAAAVGMAVFLCMGVVFSLALALERRTVLAHRILAAWLAIGITTGLLAPLATSFVRGGLPPVPRPQLEPLDADYLYWRHPTLGWIIPRLGEGWSETNEGLVSRRRWVGEIDGYWEWTETETGARWSVFSLHHHNDDDDDDDDAARDRATLVSAATAITNATHRRRGDVRDFGDGWVDFEGPVDGEITAATMRWLPYIHAGEARVLAVVVQHDPDQPCDAMLASVHVPGDPWFGPGLPPPGFTAPATELTEARRLHALRGSGFNAAAPHGEPTPPNATFSRTDYETQVGMVPAYLATPPGPPRGAVLWLHGGFDVANDLGPEGGPALLAAQGIAVMVPALRGELGSPGNYELMLGEVDDARAALAELSRRSGIPERDIVVAGWSSGATLALLVAEMGVEVRSFVCIDPMSEVSPLLDPPAPTAPFTVREPYEVWVRSPIHFLSGIRSPTFVIGSSDTPVTTGPRAIRDAAPTGVPIEVFEVPGDPQLLLLYADLIAEAIDRPGPIL